MTLNPAHFRDGLNRWVWIQIKLKLALTLLLMNKDRLHRKQNAGITGRRLVMSRKSFQKGTLQWHNARWTLLYRIKDHKTGRFTQKRECAALAQFTDRNDKKAAQEAATEFLKLINRLNSNPNTARQVNPKTGALFADFVKTRWASYVAKRKMQPSTVASYDSIIKQHLLPVFGDRELSSLTLGDMTDFFDSLRGRMKPKTYLKHFRLTQYHLRRCGGIRVDRHEASQAQAAQA